MAAITSNIIETQMDKRDLIVSGAFVGKKLRLFGFLIVISILGLAWLTLRSDVFIRQLFPDLAGPCPIKSSPSTNAPLDCIHYWQAQIEAKKLVTVQGGKPFRRKNDWTTARTYGTLNVLKP